MRQQPNITSDVFLKKRQTLQIFSNCFNSRSMALTFDDGPYIYEQNIQNTLNNNGVKGSFFLNGNNWDCIYNYQTQISNGFYAGHLMASHTWSHANLATLTWDQIHDELWKVELAFIRFFGAIPRFFRPPYGSYNDLVIAALINRGYQGMFLWNFDLGDWQTNPPSLQSEKNAYNALSTSQPVLALNHETYSQTSNQLVPWLVPAMKNKGWNLQTATICTGFSGGWWDWYTWVSPPGHRDNSWVC